VASACAAKSVCMCHCCACILGVQVQPGARPEPAPGLPPLLLAAMALKPSTGGPPTAVCMLTPHSPLPTSPASAASSLCAGLLPAFPGPMLLPPPSCALHWLPFPLLRWQAKRLHLLLTMRESAGRSREPGGAAPHRVLHQLPLHAHAQRRSSSTACLLVRHAARLSRSWGTHAVDPAGWPLLGQGAVSGARSGCLPPVSSLKHAQLAP